MPSILTHYFFVNDCINENYSFLKNEKEIALLGAQGTDPFYFYGNLLKRLDKKEVNDFASLIHNDNPFELYKHFINEANKMDDVHRDFIFSYLFGLLNHYVLDRTIHPYVFYSSGIDGNYLVDHQRFETNMDVLLRLYKGDYIAPHNTIKVDKNDVDEISRLYYLYSENNNLSLEEDTFNKAYNDLYNIQKLVYSKTGLKKWILNTFFKKSSANRISMPKRIEDGIDYLNTNKNLWQHPNKNFKMSLSIFELMDYAQKEFNKLGKILLNAYNHLDYENDLKKFIDNINHCGIEINSKMIYSNSVYK